MTFLDPAYNTIKTSTHNMSATPRYKKIPGTDANQAISRIEILKVDGHKYALYGKGLYNNISAQDQQTARTNGAANVILNCFVTRALHR